ncbi:MAG: type III secretion system export apparatus subunit SctV [Aquisalimonadaceae bacterium]
MNAKALNNLVDMAVKRTDIVLALFIILTLVLIILPIPTVMVDFMLTINIAMAVILTMVAIYIPSPVAFAAFPSVLLLVTLFRLALSITTTRLILLHADAGEIVTAFGNFVVGGNLVVGLVIFLIITVVQFLVVTKGAERVAEVSARFSLDALPGKQMSIDADVRAGSIDFEEARKRRSDVQLESQLFGSMDGAMKFVKGDAIAGIIITLINLLGGTTIGVAQLGMDFGEATTVYTILTIGDGLVAQVPALLIAIASGIIVTRVSATGEGNLGSDIGGQILAQPRALMVGGGLLVGFALVPGFPVVAFIVVGVTVGGIGVLLWKVDNQTDDAKSDFLNAMKSQERQVGGERTTAATWEMPGGKSLMLELDSALQTRLNHEALNDEFRKIRQAMFMDLGVLLPGVHIRYVDYMEPGEYRVCLHEVPVATGRLFEDKLLAFADDQQLQSLGVHPSDHTVMADKPCAWVPATGKTALEKAGVAFGDPNQVLVRHLSWALKRNASELLGVQETKGLLDRLNLEAVDLVRECTGVVPLAAITEVLKRLLRENVPVRHLQLICEVLLDKGAKQQDPSILAEFTRERLKRQISHRFCSPNQVMAVILLESEVERKIREASAKAQGDNLPLPQEFRGAMADRVRAIAGECTDPALRPAMLVKQDIRRFVRFMLVSQSLDIPVLAYQELSTEMTIQPIGEVDFDD